MGLELYAGRKIDPDHTLLIFDEVQEVPRLFLLSNISVKMRLSIILSALARCWGLPCMRGRRFR